MRRLLPLAVALVCLPLTAALTFAATLPAPPPPPHAVAAGEVIETEIPALPPDVEEFELLLVPSEGPPVRVSRELPAGTTIVRWRVPTLAARSARLVLRGGGELEERESEASEAFALAELPPSEFDRVRTGRSEAGHPLESAAGCDAAGLVGCESGASLSPGRGFLAAVTPSAPHLATPSGPSRRTPPAPDARVASTAPSVRFVQHPTFRPLRN